MKYEYSDEWKDVIQDTGLYGRQVVGATYKGYYIAIENSEYCLKDENGNTIFTSGHQYYIKKKVDELLNNKLKESDNMEDEREIINPEDKDYADGHLMCVCLWSGAGYSLSVFYVYARGDDVEYALEKTVAYCEEKEYDGLIMTTDYVYNLIDNYFKDDFIEFVKNCGGKLSGTKDGTYYEYRDDFISEWLEYVYVDATMEGASQPYYVYGENLRIENVEEPINESEESNDILDNIHVYMNTWANYNEYGADLSKYGIKDGWLTVDEALDFCEKYADDEPFINDIDDSTGLGGEVGDYTNPVQFLKGLKLLQEYAKESDRDMEEINDLWEAWQQYENTDNRQISEDLINEFKSFVEEGNYNIWHDVNNDYDLGYELVSAYGVKGINDPLMYIDDEELKSNLQYDVDSQFDEDSDEWYEVDDSEIDDFLSNCSIEQIQPYFDFEALGRAIGMEENLCFTTSGNCVELY